MMSLEDLASAYHNELRSGEELARVEGEIDCHQTSIRALSFLRCLGAPGRILRRQGRVSFERQAACRHPSGLHEWLEVPDLGIVVLDFTIGLSLANEGKIELADLRYFEPLLMPGEENSRYAYRGLLYERDPFLCFNGARDRITRVPSRPPRSIGKVA